MMNRSVIVCSTFKPEPAASHAMVKSCADASSDKEKKEKRTVVTVGIIEDCAGLGTALAAAKNHVKLTPVPRRINIKVKHLYSSESNSKLRDLLKQRYGLKKVAADACKIPGCLKAVKEKLNLVVYMNGSPCQPWSKQGDGNGLADSRSHPLKASVKFVKKHRPDVIVYEQVKAFQHQPHVAVKRHLIKKLKEIKWTKPGKNVKNREKCCLYHLKEAILTTSKIGSVGCRRAPPQERERFFLVGLKKTCTFLKKFKFPKQKPLRPGSLEKLLRLSRESMLEAEQEPTSATAVRNWQWIRDDWNENSSGPEIGGYSIVDLHSSQRFGVHFMNGTCPTITKARCGSSAFWLVYRDSKDTFLKRKLSVDEYGLLQGWPRREVKKMLSLCDKQGVMSRAELGQAFGNGFSFNVVQSMVGDLIDLAVEDTLERQGA